MPSRLVSQAHGAEPRLGKVDDTQTGDEGRPIGLDFGDEALEVISEAHLQHRDTERILV